VTVSLAAFFAVSGTILAHMAEIRKRIQSFIHFEDDISALAAVAAIRTASRHKKFSPEADMAVSAFTGSYIYFHMVRKHRDLL
jgi:hypothetical protein